MKTIERLLRYEPSYHHDNLDEVIIIIPTQMDVLDDDTLSNIFEDYEEEEDGNLFSLYSISAAFESGLNHCKDNQKAEIADYLRYRSGLPMSQADEILARIVELL